MNHSHGIDEDSGCTEPSGANPPVDLEESDENIVHEFTRDDRFRFLAQHFRESIEALRETHDELLPAASELDSLSKLGDTTLAAVKRLSDKDRDLFWSAFEDVPEDGITAQELVDRLWDAVQDTDWGPALAFNFTNRMFRPRRQPIFHNAILISVVAAFESHLAKIAEEYYRSAPEALHKVPRESAKEFSLRELQALGSIEDAVEMAIEQRVTALMFGSLTDWKKFFADRLNLDLSGLSSDWEAMQETFERRHCIVHSEALASRRYIRSYPRVEYHQPLSADSDYVHQAMENLELTGILLLMSVWSKFAVELQEVVNAMEAIGFAALKEGRWQFSLQIYERWQELPLSGAEKHMAKVNLWIARKNLFGIASITEDVEAWDVSGSSEIYAFAKLCLLEQLDGAFELLPSMVEHDHIGGQELTTWPLLAPLRDDERIHRFSDVMRHYLSEETDLAADKVTAASEFHAATSQTDEEESGYEQVQAVELSDFEGEPST